MKPTLGAALFVLVMLSVSAMPVQAEEFKAMVNIALKPAFEQLLPEYERASSNKVTPVFGGSNTLPDRLRAGETADVIFLPDTYLDPLLKQGIVKGEKVPVATSGVGIGLRPGLPKPDISTVEALKRALLEAKSIAYSDGPSGLYVSDELLPKLGIAEQVKSKCKRISGGVSIGEAIARGEADIGFQQVSEMLPVKGIQFLGPLPKEVQKTTMFSALLPANSKKPEAGRSLIRYATSPVAAAAFKKSGMEPAAR